MKCSDVTRWNGKFSGVRDNSLNNCLTPRWMLCFHYGFWIPPASRCWVFSLLGLSRMVSPQTLKLRTEMVLFDVPQWVEIRSFRMLVHHNYLLHKMIETKKFLQVNIQHDTIIDFNKGDTFITDDFPLEYNLISLLQPARVPSLLWTLWFHFLWKQTIFYGSVNHLMSPVPWQLQQRPFYRSLWDEKEQRFWGVIMSRRCWKWWGGRPPARLHEGNVYWGHSFEGTSWMVEIMRLRIRGEI